MKKIKILFFIILFTHPLAVVFGDKVGSHDQFPLELEQPLSAAATALYHLQFQESEKQLQIALTLRPDHPSSYFFKTMLMWYELAYDSLENRNPKIEANLAAWAHKTEDVARAYAAEPTQKSCAYLYWGGAEGAMGWYYIARGEWIKAYFSGKRGFNLMKRSVALDPSLLEGYLGIGMFKYYAATLGPVLKVLASVLVRGNRDEGLSLLIAAQNKSHFVRQEATYFLWNAALEERRLEDALDQAQRLLAVFPESPFFLWCQIQTYFYKGDWQKVIELSQSYIEYGNSKQKNSFDKLLAKVYFHLALAYCNQQDWHNAKLYFEKTVNVSADFKGWKAMALLNLGKLSDLDEERSQALNYYDRVLKMSEFWDSHTQAKRYLRKKFVIEETLFRFTSPSETWKQKPLR